MSDRDEAYERLRAIFEEAGGQVFEFSEGGLRASPPRSRNRSAATDPSDYRRMLNQIVDEAVRQRERPQRIEESLLRIERLLADMAAALKTMAEVLVRVEQITDDDENQNDDPLRGDVNP